MSLVLHPHKSVKRCDWQVSGSIKQQGRAIEWRMRVENPLRHAWSTHEKFGTDPRKNWELWNFDVVEAFLQPRRHDGDLTAPYLEVQLSPRGMGLGLVILEPRKICYIPYALKFEPWVGLTDTLWESSVKLQLPVELSEGELWGGIFACLGVEDRGYYSLRPNPEERPDYHRPELFQKL
jgi:hypothetical protein